MNAAVEMAEQAGAGSLTEGWETDRGSAGHTESVRVGPSTSIQTPELLFFRLPISLPFALLRNDKKSSAIACLDLQGMSKTKSLSVEMEQFL
jgi:hypothetical protein